MKRLALADRQLAEVKRFKDLELAKAQRSSGKQPLPAQRVLTDAFCVNRLEEIRKLAGDSKLKDFTKGFERDVREEEISRVFKRFRCENVDGDPPYYCVSSPMMGRLAHTFREDYLDEDNVRRTSSQLALHANEITEEAKKSMQEEARIFKRRAKTLCGHLVCDLLSERC